MTYPEFESAWLGKRVDTDGYPVGAIYQCVDLIKEYLNQVFSIPYGAFGNAIDYWANTVPAIAAKFDRVTGTPKQGDIVVINGTASNPYGHIGVATGAVTSTTTEILEQNGGTGSGNGTGTNAIRKRFIKNNTIAGLLRPKGDYMTEDGVRYGYLSVTMAQPTKEQVKYWVGRPSTEFELGMYTLADNYVVNYYNQNKALLAENAALKEQIANPPTNPDQVIITKDSLWAKFKKLIGA